MSAATLFRQAKATILEEIGRRGNFDPSDLVPYLQLSDRCGTGDRRFALPGGFEFSLYESEEPDEDGIPEIRHFDITYGGANFEVNNVNGVGFEKDGLFAQEIDAPKKEVDLLPNGNLDRRALKRRFIETLGL